MPARYGKMTEDGKVHIIDRAHDGPISWCRDHLHLRLTYERRGEIEGHYNVCKVCLQAKSATPEEAIVR